MTTNGSKRPSERTAAESLGALLRGLRSQGMTVGPDDAGRVAAAFLHSAQWSHARKVRALKALLARSEAESRMIDDLSHLLFVASERGRWISTGEQEEGPRQPFSPQEGGQSSPPAPSETGGTEALSPKKKVFLFYRRMLFGLLSLVLLFLVILLVSAYRSRAPEASLAEERKIAATDFRALGLPRDTSAPGGVEPQRPAPAGPGTGKAPRSEAGLSDASEAAKAARPQEPKKSFKEQRAEERNHAFFHHKFYPMFLFVVLAGSTATIFVRRLVRVERARLNILSLANSLGPRTYRMEADTSSLRPLDREMLRDLIARLTNFSIEAHANLVDEDRTVNETARRAGRLEFFYQKQREYRSVLFIEDVSQSMARWPGVGAQILQGLLSQGCEVAHRFMEGHPGRLAKDPDLRQELSLYEVLAEQAEPIILVLSDAKGLDSSLARERADWLGPLRQAVWLHPCSIDLWGAGARWLSEQIPVLSVCDPSSLELSGMLREERRFIRPWKVPRVVESSRPEAALLSLKESLGEAAFLWLSAGAVLDEIGVLTVRNWWALSDQEIAPVPIARLQRALSLPMVAVSRDGSVTFPEELRETLISHLYHHNPELVSRVVRWGERVLSQDLTKLPADSLAAVLARTLQARLLLVDPARRRNGIRRIKNLQAEGYGSWIDQRSKIYASALLSAPRPVDSAGQSDPLAPSLLPERSYTSIVLSYIRYRMREAFGFAQGFALMYWQIVNEQVDALSDLGLILLGVLPLFFAMLSYHWINQEIQRAQIRSEKLEQQLNEATELTRRLRLEASYLASPSWLERRAVKELGMQAPAIEQVIFWDEIPITTAPAPSSSKSADSATPPR